MNKEDVLKSALQRVARVHDWCSSGLTSLPNVAKDMRECMKEIELVIYKLQREKKNMTTPANKTDGE